MQPVAMDCAAFGAHPDDAELFAGGVLARCAAAGGRVGIAHLTRGERATRGSVDERRAEALAAAEILGVAADQVTVLDLGDTLLDNTEANRLEIVALLRRWRPRLVLGHHPHDRHPDHRKASALVEDACFYAGVRGVDTGQDPFRPHGRLMFLNTTTAGVAPSLVVDVTETFGRKLEALRAYRSQFHNPDHAGEETYVSSREYIEQVEVRARYYGGMIGVRYGEAFCSPSPLPVSDPVALFSSPIP